MRRYKVEVDSRDGYFYCVVDTHKNNTIVAEACVKEMTHRPLVALRAQVSLLMDTRARAMNQEYETYQRCLFEVLK